MSFPRVNTTQVAAISASGAAATLKLPNASTGALPADQTGTINPIGADHRWRIKSVIASYSAAGTGQLTISDGTFTWTIDVPNLAVLQNLDLQCGPGAEVDVTLSGVASAVAHLNLSVVSE